MAEEKMKAEIRAKLTAEIDQYEAKLLQLANSTRDDILRETIVNIVNLINAKMQLLGHLSAD